ncbi:MFS transporter [Paenibacillus senegalensis]|uniref:hypothetical protein n=1 Tax=Paenibacillus senegalensis TaxID=1465766 RepID=UPI00028A1B05|nr:hypothetical protein [Paenibacillus senegalensis]
MSKQSNRQNHRQKHDRAVKPEPARKETERDTELAADLTQVPVMAREHEAADNQEVHREYPERSVARWFGWTALVISILSLFVLPGLLGPAGAIVGFIAYIQGSRTLGVWAMVLGAISLFVALFLSPYY